VAAIPEDLPAAASQVHHTRHSKEVVSQEDPVEERREVSEERIFVEVEAEVADDDGVVGGRCWGLFLWSWEVGDG